MESDDGLRIYMGKQHKNTNKHEVLQTKSFYTSLELSFSHEERYEQLSSTRNKITEKDNTEVQPTVQKEIINQRKIIADLEAEMNRVSLLSE